MKTASRLRGVCLVAAATAALAACSSDDTTTPAATGSVDATITDGAFNAIAAAGAAADRQGGPQAVADLTGTMEGSAQVSIYSDADGWIDLGDARSVSVSLQTGEDASVAEAASVPAGTYTKVRLTLSGFHANLDAGSVIDGSTLLAAVSVTMGGSDNEVVIETDVPAITIEAEGSATVGFDLNSAAWVTPQTAETEMADDADIQAATTAMAETT
jgi:hypothetical protein